MRFAFQLIPPCLALKKIYWRLRFEEFEEDLVSVVLRTIRYYYFCFGRVGPGSSPRNKVDLKPTDKSAADHSAR